MRDAKLAENVSGGPHVVAVRDPPALLLRDQPVPLREVVVRLAADLIRLPVLDLSLSSENVRLTVQ
jgi:hypothetical protein